MFKNKKNNLMKITLFLEKYFIPMAGKISEQKHLGAIREGMMAAMPLLIIGSAFLILGFIPIQGYSEFMSKLFGTDWLKKVLIPVGATFDLMALFTNIGISYKLCEKYKVEPLLGSMISLGAFILVTPNSIKFNGRIIENVILTTFLGGKGLFISMIMAILAAEIYRILIQKNIVIKLPPSVPPTIGKSFVALIPGATVITLFWIIDLVVSATSFENIHYIISKLLIGPISTIGSSYIGIIMLVLLANLLWICGIHGSNIVYGIAAPMLYILMDQNLQAFRTGQLLPNIVSQNMFDIFVSVGGAGGTLGLAILMAFKAKSTHLKELGKLSFIPSLFNINEPIIFGTPIVMNPIMIIPFIINPLIAVSLAYFSMKIGIIGRLTGVSVPWTSPPFLGAFIASNGNVYTGILQLIIVSIQLIVWYPFFKIMDKHQMNRELY